MVMRKLELAGVAAILAAGFAAAHAQDATLGRNMAGETCQAAPGADRTLAVTCGQPGTDAGQVRALALAQTLPADPAARHEAISKVLAAEQANGQMTCDAPQWLGGDDVLVACTLKSNGWPRIVVASVSANRLYRAEGMPGALPVLEAAIARQSGAAFSPASSAAAARIVQGKYEAGVLHAGSADYASYAQFIVAGRLQGSRNNYAGAEAAYRQALMIEEKLFGSNSVIVGETLAELALQVSNQQRFDEAGKLFQRATPIIESSSSDAARARLNSYLALNAANQRNYADALKFAHDATAARRAEINDAGGGKAGSPTAVPVNRGELAHSLRIEAEMAMRLGDLAGARASAEEALWIISEQPGLPLWWRPDVVSLMGEINEHDGRVVAAERDFRDARDLDAKLFGDSAPTAQADLRLGHFYSDQQLYPASVEAYRKAFAILAKDRNARSQVVSDQIVPFIKADAAIGGDADRAARDTEIFKASQLANSSVADQAIARVAAREAAATPQLAALVAQAQDAARARDTARVELAAEYAKADDERSAAREDKLGASLKLASARADDLMAQVAQNYPQYSKLADPSAATLADVQAQLRPGEAMLSFVIGVNDGYALLVKQNEMAIAPLKVGQGQLAADVADLRKAFVPTLGKLPPFSLKNSYALYTELLGPLEARLGGVNHLIVAPSGALADLPLSLLVTQSPADQNYAQAAWLVRRMAVSQVPSPRAFVSLRQAAASRVAASRSFLGIGNPAFHGAGGAVGAKALGALADSCQQEGPASADLLRALPPLPDTAREVQTVAARMGGGHDTILLGAQATEANVRAQPLGQYAVIYFATHGILPGQLHCQSEPGLVLSPPSGASASTNTDGILAASEIAQLKLNADLVVLSACNTAQAPSGMGGSSLEGLADAFFAAGAQGVLASHWEVPSAATEQLMVGVFTDSARTGPLAESLRRSQLALISQGSTAHPFYWAAFTLIGGGAKGAPASYQAASIEAGKP